MRAVKTTTSSSAWEQPSYSEPLQRNRMNAPRCTLSIVIMLLAFTAGARAGGDDAPVSAGKSLDLAVAAATTNTMANR